MLHFRFWKPVYFSSDDSIFPSNSTEETGRFVGISGNVRHYVTFSILNSITNVIISRYDVRSAGKPTSPILRIDLLTTPKVITSRHLPSVHLENDDKSPAFAKGEAHNAYTSSPKNSMPILDPNDLVGRNFLIPQEDGQLLRARIVKDIDECYGKL